MTRSATIVVDNNKKDEAAIYFIFSIKKMCDSGQQRFSFCFFGICEMHNDVFRSFWLFGTIAFASSSVVAS